MIWGTYPGTMRSRAISALKAPQTFFASSTQLDFANMATERKPVPTSAMYMTVDSHIITILVGPENQQQSFRVHQSLLEA